jgi:hypothetical protein
MENSKPSNNSVVEPLSMPKMKISGEKAAALNAFALSFAAFFGFLSIFAAIASFAKVDWTFTIPLIGIALANVSYISIAFITALLAVAFAIIGIMTLKKITDKNTLSRYWYRVSKIFLVLAIIYSVVFVAIALYSLMGLGRKSGVNHGTLWLDGALPNRMTAVGAGIVCCYAKSIAGGKTAILRTFSVIAITIASIGLIVAVVQTLTGFYSDKSSSRHPANNSQYYDIWDLYR